MLSRFRSVLQRLRPRVRVDLVDLSDGETLQLSGDASAWLVRRLRLVAVADERRVAARAERISSSRRRSRFHVVLDITPLLDRPGGAIRASFGSPVGRCRVEWLRGAFADPNAAVVRAVAPDALRGIHCIVQRSADRSGVTVVRKRVHPRVALASISLDEACSVGLVGDESVRSVAWTNKNDTVHAERTTHGWVWPDISQLARRGTRWSLVAECADGRTIAIGLPLGDLRDPGAARVFPVVKVWRDDERFRLAAAVDRRRRVVLGSRRVGATTGGTA